MNLFLRINQLAVPLIGAMLLCAPASTHADDLSNANKLFRQGNLTLALENVEAYLANKPKDAQARFLKGLILTEQNNIPQAIQIFSDLTTDYPELPEPYNNLAVLYASQGNYDKAKLALERAIRTHPSYSTAHENLGDIYAKMASQAYDRALQLDRGNAATQTKLAMIQDIFAPQPSKKDVAVSDTKSPPQPVIAAKTDVTSPEQPKKVASVQPTKVAPVAVPASAAPTNPQPVASVRKETQPKPANAILKTVEAWAAAWSAQKVDDYLSFYAPDFRPLAGESRQSWETTRRARISTPTSIQVTIGKPTVRMTDDSHATIRFRQTYRASHHVSQANKTLQMVKVGDKWLIQEEVSK